MIPEKKNSFSWKSYRGNIEPVINRVLWIYFIFSVAVLLVQYLIDYQDIVTLKINAGISLVLMFFAFAARKLSLTVKMLILSGMALYSIISSLMINGLQSTAFLTVVAMVLVLTLFLKTKVAILIAALLFTALGVFVWQVHLGRIVYGPEVFARINSMGLWFPAYATLGANLCIIIMSLDYFRKRTFKTISFLEDANAMLREREEELDHLAYYDPLTGLLNRSGFFKILEKRADLGYLEGGHIVLCNIKRFRVVNLLLGAERGDQTLTLIGKVLNDVVGGKDLLARMMGDEFVFWVESGGEEFILSKIEEIKHILDRIISDSTEGIPVEWYVSAAEYRSGDSLNECYSRADVALQNAKRQDLDELCFFRPGMLTEVEGEAALLKDLKEALASSGLRMFYQRQVLAAAGETVGVEALVRWKRKGEYLLPGDFLHLIDRNNLTGDFGYEVIETVFRDMPELLEKYGSTISVSINISPILFLSTGFVDRINGMAERCAVDPQRIVLEFTEDVFLEDLQMIEHSLLGLKELGFRISLDDFGTGFSSLSYLSRMTLDEVKIDRSFVNQICSDKKMQGIVRSIYHIADDLGFNVVAEGIETKEQLAALSAIGGRIVQGFYFSKPEAL